jgi:hypothetical protein
MGFVMSRYGARHAQMQLLQSTPEGVRRVTTYEETPTALHTTLQLPMGRTLEVEHKALEVDWDWEEEKPTRTDRDIDLQFSW